jgi:hypothetical protein
MPSDEKVDGLAEVLSYIKRKWQLRELKCIFIGCYALRYETNSEQCTRRAVQPLIEQGLSNA